MAFRRFAAGAEPQVDRVKALAPRQTSRLAGHSVDTVRLFDGLEGPRAYPVVAAGDEAMSRAYARSGAADSDDRGGNLALAISGAICGGLAAYAAVVLAQEGYPGAALATIAVGIGAFAVVALVAKAGGNARRRPTNAKVALYGRWLVYAWDIIGADASGYRDDHWHNTAVALVDMGRVMSDGAWAQLPGAVAVLPDEVWVFDRLTHGAPASFAEASQVSHTEDERDYVLVMPDVFPRLSLSAMFASAAREGAWRPVGSPSPPALATIT